MTTTAQFRTAARDAASVCNWQEAADLLDRAIQAYPNATGAMAKADIAGLKATADAYRASADAELGDDPLGDWHGRNE